MSHEFMSLLMLNCPIITNQKSIFSKLLENFWKIYEKFGLETIFQKLQPVAETGHFIKGW